MSNAHALDGYLQRDPEGWHGFPRASEADLASRYSFSPGEGRARRGLDRIDYRFRALKRPGFATPFVFYFAGDTLAFIETEFWSLDAELCAQTIAALGPPPETAWMASSVKAWSHQASGFIPRGASPYA